MGWDVSKGFEGIDHNFLTAKVEDLIQWSRSKSSWPVTFGLWEMMIFAAAVFVSFIYLIGNGALNWGPVKRLTALTDSRRTTESTVRRVGAEGRSTPVAKQGAA